VKILSLFLCFLLIFQTTVFAAGKSTILKKDQKAPFAETLLHAKAIAEILAQTKKLKDELKLKLTQQKEKLKIEHDFKYNLLKADFSSLEKRTKDLIILKDGELVRLQKLALKRPGRHSHWFFAAGVVVGVGVAIAITYVVTNAISSATSNSIDKALSGDLKVTLGAAENK
jgi:hypothetical protein